MRVRNGLERDKRSRGVHRAGRMNHKSSVHAKVKEPSGLNPWSWKIPGQLRPWATTTEPVL